MPEAPLSDSELVEDLCLALRDVGVANECLPDLGTVREHIERVQAIWREIEARRLDVTARLRELEQQTGWPMTRLLQDSLNYPAALPYLDGTVPTCGECETRLSKRDVLGLCDSCLSFGLTVAAQANPPGHLDICSICGVSQRGFVVYAHAAEWMNYCSSCLAAERTRRVSRV